VGRQVSTEPRHSVTAFCEIHLNWLLVPTGLLMWTALAKSKVWGKLIPIGIYMSQPPLHSSIFTYTITVTPPSVRATWCHSYPTRYHSHSIFPTPPSTQCHSHICYQIYLVSQPFSATVTRCHSYPGSQLPGVTATQCHSYLVSQLKDQIN